MRIVKKICNMCKIYAKFRQEFPRSEWQSLLYFEKPGEIVYEDVIGLLPPRRGGVKYIHCIIDSATRVAKDSKLKVLNTRNIIKIFEYWMQECGLIQILVTDNAPYYASQEIRCWCSQYNIAHRFTSPYRHQSMGLVG